MKKLSYAAIPAAFLALSATTVDAATVGFGFNAGPVTSIRHNAPAAIQAFQLGEDIFIEFTMSSTVADTDRSSRGGNFEDRSGTLRITGLTSGATLDISGGVEVDLDDTEEFELESARNRPNAANPFVMTDDTDLDTMGNGDLVSNPNDLAQSIRELAALVNSNGFFTVVNRDRADGGIDYYDPIRRRVIRDVIEFGPVPTGQPDPVAPSPVPLPASALFLAAGLAGLGAMRRRKT